MNSTVLSLNELIRNFGNIVNAQTDTPAQQQALLSTKSTIDTITQTLLNRHNFPLSPNWDIEELTAQVIEE